MLVSKNSIELGKDKDERCGEELPIVRRRLPGLPVKDGKRNTRLPRRFREGSLTTFLAMTF